MYKLNIFDEKTGKAAILRNAIGNYLKVGEAFELMGAGFTKLDENPGAQSDSEVYINEITSSASITSYETTFPFDTRLMPSEKAGYALYKVGRDHKTGDEAQFTYVIVDLFNPIDGGEGASEYKARQFEVVANISSFSGGGGEKFQASGELQAVGDPVQGKFDTTTKSFTAGDFKGKYDLDEAAG